MHDQSSGETANETIGIDSLKIAASPASRDTKGHAYEHHIVGIGASAGGLKALEKLFAGMPLDTGMSFVVIQHLSLTLSPANLERSIASSSREKTS